MIPTKERSLFAKLLPIKRPGQEAFFLLKKSARISWMIGVPVLLTVTLTMMTLLQSSRPVRSLSATTQRSASASAASVAALLESFSCTDDDVDDANNTFSVYNPAAAALDPPLAKLRTMNAADAREAVARSAAALPGWRDGTTATARAAILTQWSQNIKANAASMAAVMTLESGKPLAESAGEVAYAASFLDYYAAEAVRPTGAGGGFLVPTPFGHGDGAPRGQIMATHQAVGTCAMISPWNFPAASTYPSILAPASRRNIHLTLHLVLSYP